MLSALYFVFENQKIEEKAVCFGPNYNKIFSLFVLPALSDKMYLLLESNNFFSLLFENTTQKTNTANNRLILMAIRLNLLFHVSFNEKTRYYNVINNFFKLLKVDSPNLFADRAFQDKNKEFLEKYLDLVPFLFSIIKSYKN